MWASFCSEYFFYLQCVHMLIIKSSPGTSLLFTMLSVYHIFCSLHSPLFLLSPLLSLSPLSPSSLSSPTLHIIPFFSFPSLLSLGSSSPHSLFDSLHFLPISPPLTLLHSTCFSPCSLSHLPQPPFPLSYKHRIIELQLSLYPESHVVTKQALHSQRTTPREKMAAIVCYGQQKCLLALLNHLEGSTDT